MTGSPGAAISKKILRNLKAPSGSNDTSLDIFEDRFQCRETGEDFGFVDSVPSLYGTLDADGVDVTGRVKSFYEENPFPNYEGLEEFGQLVQKGSQNPFSADLLGAIGYNKTILECGCGTGQLSHFLQLNNNYVLGIDMSLSSLKLAEEHRQRNQLQRSAFIQMNIFDLAIKDNSFDVAISHGVLHHTYDAKKAFGHIVQKLKPGGIIMVGLYNSYARIPTWIRSKLINLLGPKIDYVVRNRIVDERKAEIWIKDQYFNPHETWHSVDEVLGCFEEFGVAFRNCSPAILGTSGEGAENLFAKTEPGNSYQRAITQMSWIGSIAREGALFDVIGEKAGPA